MPNRILKESIKTSAQVDALSWFEEVVFYRLIVTADDYGCLDGRIILLKNELFPTKDSITKKAIEDAVAKLASVGLLCRYTVNGMPYLCFPSWEKHQRIRNKHRKYPAPPVDGDSLTNDGQSPANCHSESNPIQSESESESESKGARARTFTPPTVAQVAEYCRERKNDVDPERFVDFYASKGWKVGNQPMKDWRAAVRTWEKREEGGAKRGLSEPAAAGDRGGDRDAAWGISGLKLD